MKMKISKKILCTLVIAVISLSLYATVKLPVIFQSNMVLQRDKVINIQGFGDESEKVTISFKGQTFTSVTGKDGKWLIQLPPQKAGGPFDILVKGRTNSVELKNVLIGDVWICGGQSNMALTLDQIGYIPKDSVAISKTNIRIFTASIDMDYIPKNDLKGGIWKEASTESLRYFSATAYFFGKFLHDSLNVPIGLVSDNLGATSIETWMSAEALSKFPQFSNYYKEYLAPAKSFKEVTEAFEKIKPDWELNYYWKGQGIEKKWFLPETDIRDWETMEIPCWWEDNGLADFDGAVWFRKNFDRPKDFAGDSLPLYLNQIDDYDIVWVNGHKVGEGYGNQNWRNYKIPANILYPQDNIIVVRVFDAGGKGGMFSGAIWGNNILLGKWFYKPDDKINTAIFPKPHVVNVSPFSTPAVLYNGNIAPLTSLSIKGFIWYQGESNASRAKEYRDLFPQLINDWRSHFNQGDLPFLFVQLANYMEEEDIPKDCLWGELRDAQTSALKLPNTGMAVTIDIGDANDIHPKNKMDVGKRLGLAALKVAYNIDIVSKGPTYEAIEIINNTAVIKYEKGTDNLMTKDKYGYIKGFAMAGKDKKFYWAKALIQDNKVYVSCNNVTDPVAVRYAWSNNPGTIDLYNKSGLPAVPFRTDDWTLSTTGKVFSEDPWNF
jgi:sialate O-acetylesterase